MKSTFVSTFALIVFSLGAGMSVTNTTTAKVIDTPDGSFTLAQTQGMERRQDRRDTRQDCREAEGLFGADKRDCKQDKRNGDDDDDVKPVQPTAPVPPATVPPQGG